MSMWRNDQECKYMFLFPLKNVARKGLWNSDIFIEEDACEYMWIFYKLMF